LKSKVVDERFYIECSCTDPDHLLVFDFWDFGREGDYTEISAQFTSPYHDSFWRRLGYFFKYLFNKDRYLGTSDSIIFNRKNLEQLKDVVVRMEEILDKREKERVKIPKKPIPPKNELIKEGSNKDLNRP